MILFHALTNTLAAIPFGNMQPMITLLIAIMPWLVVAAMKKMLSKGEFPGLSIPEINKGTPIPKQEL